MTDGTGTARSPLVGRRARLVLGAVILAAILLFVWYRLDWRAVVSVVARADPTLLVVGIVAALAGLACWSEAMRHMLPSDAAPVTRRRGFLVYATGALVRNAIPLGYASSIAVLGYVYRRETSLSIDRTLAAVSVAELLSAMASTGYAVVGLLLLATTSTRSPAFGWLVIGVAVVVGGGVVAVALLWYRRDAVHRVVHAVASLLSSIAGRLGNGRPGAVTPEAVERALAGYYRSVSSVSTRRREVRVAVGYSVLAWGALVASLYVCGLAVGYRIPLPLAMVVVSVGGYATILPLPGGVGGYELGVAGVITVLGGTDVVTALAVTILFRVCSFWAFIATGLVASAVLSVDLRRLVSVVLSPGGVDVGSADR